MVQYTLMTLEAFHDWWAVNGPYTLPGTRCMLLRQGTPACDTQMQPVRIMHPVPRMLVVQPDDGEYVPDFRELPGHGPEDVTVRPVPMLHEGGAFVTMTLLPRDATTPPGSDGRMMVADWREAMGGVTLPEAMPQPVPPAVQMPMQPPVQLDWDMLERACSLAVAR